MQWGRSDSPAPLLLSRDRGEPEPGLQRRDAPNAPTGRRLHAAVMSAVCDPARNREHLTPPGSGEETPPSHASPPQRQPENYTTQNAFLPCACVQIIVTLLTGYRCSQANLKTAVFPRMLCSFKDLVPTSTVQLSDSARKCSGYAWEGLREVTGKEAVGGSLASLTGPEAEGEA
ncbi:hypothetical protein UY3_03177 [Chelonia mydas]|uniref:Uncharacterized protein n=1 Tax=Chelonia mydas TaxID=8469 RepID=M7BNT8_CHEMY|nr:hypothetical protein UY3_03177 [Chelonia mydas]